MPHIIKNDKRNYINAKDNTFTIRRLKKPLNFQVIFSL